MQEMDMWRLFAAALMLAGASTAAFASQETDGFYDPTAGRFVTHASLSMPVGFGGTNYTPIPRVEVDFESRERPGTIVINTEQRRLFLVLGNGRALRYGIGVGRDGFSWGGVQSVTAKQEWPDWRPPAQMLQRRPDLPRFMPGGESNPLGARALYLGSTLYRIHGSNEPHTIGQAVSSGCFRMTNDDVADLYERVRVGARVVVLR
jgi:lipoprotein-anchoring transpeptidase ErfK/SrfK